MSDAAKKKPEPDAGLLEFLGDIDEANDENQDDDFSEFLASHDIDRPESGAKEPQKPAKVKND